LFEFLNVGEEYKSQIKILEREKLNLGKSISRNQARLESPKELALQARRNAIEDEISKYKQSEFYSRAFRHEKEQMLSMELARFDEDFAAKVLGFDSAEWESLWRTDLSQSNLYKLRTRKGSLVSQRNKLAKTEESFRRGYPGYLETGPSPRTSKLQELDNAISAVDEDIRIFTSRDLAMNKFGKLYDELSDNGTRDAVSNLRSRAKNKDFQYFRSSDNVNIYTDATNISSRREQLVGAYNLSEESRLMQEVRFLQGEFDASMQNSFLSNTEEVAVRYDELVAQIEQVRGKLNQNTLEIQDVESTLYKEIGKVATPSRKSHRLWLTKRGVFLLRQRLHLKSLLLCLNKIGLVFVGNLLLRVLRIRRSSRLLPVLTRYCDKLLGMIWAMLSLTLQLVWQKQNLLNLVNLYSMSPRLEEYRKHKKILLVSVLLLEVLSKI
jgi:hypothetical protein